MKDQIWTDEFTGLICLIKQHPTLLHLCGYVGVTRDHPWAGKNYSDCPLSSAKPCGAKPSDGEVCLGLTLPQSWLDRMAQRLVCDEEFCKHTPEYIIVVHGGLTFAGEWSDHGGADIWWFGFDCGHYGDLSPGKPFGGEEGTYRDENYVKQECQKLAKQLKEVK